MTPLHRIYVTELWKLAKRPMTWTLGVILVALVVLIYGTLVATILVPEGMGIEVDVQSPVGGLEESLILPDGLYMGIGLVQLLVTVLVIVLAAGMVGSELSWGTVRTMIMMGAGRVRILAAKILALISYGLAAAVVGLLLAIIGSIVTGLIVGEGLLASEWMTLGFMGEASILLLRTLVGIALWGMLAATITLVSQSLAAGLGASLALFLLGGQIAGLIGNLGTFGTWLARALPNSGVDALVALNHLTPPNYGFSDWTWIIGNLAGWVIALTIISVFTFRRMDTLAAGS